MDLSKEKKLKNILLKLTPFIALVIMVTSCGSKHHRQEKHKVNPECVYVCSGPASRQSNVTVSPAGMLRMLSASATRITRCGFFGVLLVFVSILFINFAVKISVLHCAYTGLTLQS